MPSTYVAVAHAIANNVTIMTIGFGNQSYYNEPLLQDIANLTGGYIIVQKMLVL